MDIPKFEGIIKRIARWANGRAKREKDGSFTTETRNRDKGGVDPKFIEKHGLTTATRPSEYIDLLLPLKKNTVNGREIFSFDLAARWTNMKAVFANAGPEGNCYQDY